MRSSTTRSGRCAWRSRPDGSSRSRRTTTRRPPQRTVDLADDEVLLPGLVDTHVHVNEPGRTEWEGFESATLAAAAGGVTTILDMPLNAIPPTTTVAALEVKREVAEGQCFVDVGFWGGAVPGNLADLEALHEAGVFGFKCFLLDSGVPEFPHLGQEAFSGAMRECARIGALMIVHAEDGALIDAHALDGPSYAGFLASRPHESEDVAVARVMRQAIKTGARAHIVHLCSATALERDRVRAAGRRRRERRDLPPLPDLRGRADRRRIDGVQVLPADPRGRQPRGTVGGPRRGQHRHGGLRPLAVHGHAEATRARRLRPGLGRHRLGAARPASGVDRRAGARRTRSSTWCSGWLPRRPSVWVCATADA